MSSEKVNEVANPQEKTVLDSETILTETYVETTTYSETTNVSSNEVKTEKSELDVDFSIVDALPLQKQTKSGDDEKSEKKNAGENKKDDTGADASPDKVSLLALFRFADHLDVFLMLIGSVCAAGNGAGLPIMTIIFSNIIQIFTDFVLAYNVNGEYETARDNLKTSLNKQLLYFLILGVSVFVLAYIQVSSWMIAGERQAKRVRELYYAAILRQDISWFDASSTGDVTTRISGDVSLLQEGISEKVAGIIQYMTVFFSGFIIAFTKGWKLSLVLSCVLPLIAAAGGVMAYSIAAYSSQGQDAYAGAGAVADQVLSSIRTVAAFGGQQRELERYKQQLVKAYKLGKTKGIISGIGIGSIMMIMFATYALAFWYGSRLVVSGEMTGGQVLNVFFAIIIGAFSLGNAAPNFSAVGSASGAAAKLFSIIDRVPEIDVTSDEGERLKKSDVRGQIEFKKVNFHYPQRPDVPILKNFSLTIEPGQTVALVGSSGSGKSTIVSLLERFYDPVSGSIELDGIELKAINIKSLRTQIGLVGQEPVLFSTSIKQNIKFGGALGEPEPTDEEIIEACKKSNAHDFIDELPEKYDTLVGERGALMSGGQKQRIAIARALIKDPAILLLDEATSALDTESEREVQAALDKATSGTNRTTIVIAHRLSTIKHADKIVVMSKGEIVEAGQHDELIERQGVYYQLVKAQELKTKQDSEGEDDDSDNIQNGDFTVNIDRKELLRKMSTMDSNVKSIEEISDEEEKRKEKSPLLRVAKINSPEWYFILLGCAGAIINGVVMPMFSLIFSKILVVFQKTNEPDELKSGANFWSAMFVVLAVSAFLSNFSQIAFFSISAERLTKRLRTLCFQTLLKQEMGFFDMEKNSTGALTSKLAVDATDVEGLSGRLMGTIVQTLASLVSGFVIAFANGWKMTLVVAAAAPALGIAAFLEMKSLAGFGGKTRKAYEQSGQIIQQSVSNIRTVAALSREEQFKTMYHNSIAVPHRIAVKGVLVSSIGFGASQGLQFLVWTFAFWYGGKLVADLEYSVSKMLTILFAVIFSAMALGQMSMFAPNTAKAKLAALSIFEILDLKSTIDPTDNEGKARPVPVTGEANISGAYFNYPARPRVRILRGLNMKTLAGKTVALVGGSGSGKSTVISLFMRYYDVFSGSVNVEKTDVRDWNLEYLRDNMALVGQEPVLFDLTIGENIAYGKEGCTEEEIIEASKGANIHNFIMGLPEGYKTSVGEKGAQLSGGQKQRVAIARALIRAPKLLLLDEATSALDSESEKIVQMALDKISAGRTTITIAHRLSTVQDADLILVVKRGRVIEQGKHLDLIAQRGLYYELVTEQTLT